MTNQNFRVKNGLQVGNITIDSGSGIITATKFVGDGSSLTNLPSGGGGGGGASDFVRTSAGIHTTSGVGIGTTSINSFVLNVGKPGVGDTTNYILTYGNIDNNVWGGIGTHSVLHSGFIADDNDNVYVVGGFYDTYDRSPLNLDYYDVDNYPYKPFVCKINSSNQIEEQYSFSSNSNYFTTSIASGICSATDGDIVVAIRSYEQDGYNQNTGVNGLSFVKLNSSGTIIWQTHINNISHFIDTDRFSENNIVLLASDSEGNIYASGRVWVTSQYECYLIKIGPSGNIIFDQILTGTEGPHYLDIIGSNLYWCGLGISRIFIKFDLNGNFISGASLSPTYSSAKYAVDNNENVYILSYVGDAYLLEKYNSSFTHQWSRSINSESIFENDFNGTARSIQVDLNGNIYVISENYNKISCHKNGYEMFKFNSFGDLMWKRFLGVPSLLNGGGLVSQIQIKNNKLKFVADIETPQAYKDILGGREDNPAINWIEKNSSQTYSMLIANLDIDGDFIGEYGIYSIEELEVIRGAQYLNPPGKVGITSSISQYFTVNTSVGVSTASAGFTTSLIGIIKASINGLFGGATNDNPNLFSDTREFFGLNITGTSKLSKLIVSNIEFGGGGNAGSQNISIGYSAGSILNSSDSNHSYNIFIGSYATPGEPWGSNSFNWNNFIGYRAGNYSSEGSNNNYFGSFTGYYTAGYYNNFFGTYAGYANAWGECNIFIGCRAGAFTAGSTETVMIGNGAGGFGGGYGGYGHVFIGRYAGAYSPYNLNYTSYNTFVGSSAGCCGPGGEGNTFIGAYAGAYNITGNYNNFFGCGSGSYNTTGSCNNFFGYLVGYCNSTGNLNNFIGRYAGYNNTVGSYNNFFGANAGCSNSSSYKTIIGSSDDANYYFDCPNPEKDRQLAIGHQINGDNKYWILGDEYYNIGIGTTSINSRLHVTSSAFTNPGIGSETWILQYGDIGVDNDYQRFSAVSYDSLGNIYTCGGTDSWGYAFVIKTDPYGSVIWEKFFDHPDANKDIHSAEAIFVDKATDDVYVAIHVYDVVYSIILIKLNSSGDILWQREIDGLGEEYATSVSVSSNDYVFVLGSANSHEGQTDKDLLLVAFDKSGTELWKRNIGGIYDDEGWQVDSTANYVFVAGKCRDQQNYNEAFLVYGFSNVNGNTICDRTFRILGDTYTQDYTLSGLVIRESNYYYGSWIDVLVCGKSAFHGIIVNQYRAYPNNGYVNVERSYKISPLDPNEGDEVYGIVADSNLNQIFITGVRYNKIYVCAGSIYGGVTWTKEIEALNGDEALQSFIYGRNCIDINTNDNRITICGYRNKLSTNETDGLLIQLPYDVINVDGTYGTNNKFKVSKANYGSVQIYDYLTDEDANVGYGVSVGISTVVVSTSGIITSTSPPSYTPLLLNFIPDSLYNDAATFDGNVVINGGQLSFNNGASIGGNLGIGTTNPITKLQIGSVFNPQVLGFGTVTGYLYSSTNILIGDEKTGSSLTPQAVASWKGLSNVFIGPGAGAAATTANSNIFIGLNAGCSTTDGYYNNFFGTYTGCSNTTGFGNNFMGGYLTGVNNTTGSDNNFFGVGAGSSNTTGSCNNFFGYYVGKYNTVGSRNNFIGINAGYYNINGCYNNFLGVCAGYYNDTGCYNNFIGSGAGYFNTTGCYNLFLGSNVGTTTAASYKIVLGGGPGNFDSLDTTKDYQLAVGISTISNFTSVKKYWLTGNEYFNISIDGPALTLDRFENLDRIYIGRGSGNGWSADGNEINYAYGQIVIGAESGIGTTTLGSGGGGNIIIGNYAGCNIIGNENIFFGSYSANNTLGLTGDWNVSVGNWNGRTITTGRSNSLFGYAVGRCITTGSYNSFFGLFSGYVTTTGSYNNFFGYLSGCSNTTGNLNSFFGTESGRSNKTGSYNVFIGNSAGVANTSGSYNVFVGSYVGLSTTSSHRVIIGSGVDAAPPIFGTNYFFDAPNNTKDIQFAIGVRTDANPSKYWLVGDENFNVGIGTTNPTTKLHVGGDVKVGINTSQGIILTSPNGTAYRLVVDDSGNLTTTLA